MRGLIWRVLRDRWQLLVGTLCAITLGVGLVHSGLAIATTIASARPPAGLDAAGRAAYTARLDGTNTINGIASILGMFLAVMVVRSTIDFAVTERRRELSLLRLVGVKRRQLRWMLLGEAAVLGVLGTLLGSVLGVALAAVQRRLYVRMGIMPADVRVPWTFVQLAVDAGAGLGVALAGSRAASRRAARVSPLDGLRRQGAERVLMTRGRWVWGVLMTCATLAQAVLAQQVGGVMMPVLMALGIIITGSTAANQIAPVVVPVVVRLTQPMVRGPLGQLALAGVRDNARRTAQVVAPLVALVGLVAGLQGVLDTQSKAGDVEAAATTRADLLVTTKGDPSAAVASVPGVASADAEAYVPATVSLVKGTTATGDSVLPVDVVAVDPARFAAMHPYRLASGSVAAFDDHHAVLGPGVEDAQGGGTRAVDLTLGARHVRLPVAARTGEGVAANDGVYVPRDIVPTSVLAASPTTVLVVVRPGADRAQVAARITAQHLGTVSTPAEAAARRRVTQDAENRSVMVALVGVGSVYALISLLSTLAIATGQRRPEFAVDRLSGLTRRQVHRLVAVETLVTLGVGVGLGTGVSMVALLGLWSSTWHMFGTPVIAVPWRLLLGLAGLVTALALATSTFAARRATSRPPIHDLTTEE